jgi:hypothetical protein
VKRIMTKKLVSSLAAVVLAAFSGLAQAENVSFTGFAHGSHTVTATLTAPDNTALVRSVSAGGFTTILNGGPSFESYCVDLYQNIAFGAPPYTEYVDAGSGHVFTNGNAYADLGRLYATAGLVNNALTEAAFQIAVWEIAYEKTGTAYNLASGAASFAGGSAASSGALTLASTWLTNLAAGGPSIGVLESRLHQDVIYAQPVPEPEVVLLMAAGLLGVSAAARRKAKAKSQA